MKTQDLFKIHREADRLNEGLNKTFGTRLNLESFDLEKLQDARNRLRTQISQFTEGSNFNENLANEAYHKARFMLDAINAEIAERQQFIVNAGSAGMEEGKMSEVDMELRDIAKSGDEEQLIDAMGGLMGGAVADVLEEMMSNLADKLAAKGMDDVINDEDKMIELLMDKLIKEYGDDDLSEGFSEYKDMFDDWMNSENAPSKDMAGDDRAIMQKAEEFLQGEVPDNEISNVAEILTKMYHGESDVNVDKNGVRDDLINEIEMILDGALGGTNQTDHIIDELGDIFQDIESSGDKVAMAAYEMMNDVIDQDTRLQIRAARKALEMLKQGDETDEANMKESIDTRSITTGESMSNVTEGEIQQASAIVTAKTMVDRVSRWIEELSGMENDTLLQLGDSIRDEMGQQQAKAFIEAVAPAIQQALENLKTTRETLSTGLRALTGEEQPAEMLGSTPEAAAVPDEEMAAAEPDTMNQGEPVGDEFAAAEPAAGGAEAAGREKRESINYGNRLMKVLAG